MGDLTEVRGKWWNPLSKERVAPGTLTLTDDEPVLTYDYRSHGSEGDRIVLDDTVHGLLDDGRAVTLWDWRVGGPKSTKRYVHDRDLTEYERTFTHAVLGAHCQSIEESRFDAVRVRFKHLKALLRTEEVLAMDAEPSPSGTAGFMWGDDAPYSIEVSLHDRPLLEYRKYPSEDEPHECFSRFLGDEAAVVFTSDRPASYEIYDQLLYNMQLLTAFTYQAALPRTSWEVRLPGSKDWLTVATTQSLKTPTKRSHFFPERLVVSGEDTAPETLIARWFEAVNDLYPLPQVLAIQFLSPGGVMEAKLLIGLSALEKAHSVLPFKPEKFPDDDLSALKKKLKRTLSEWLDETSIDLDHRQRYRAWLSESLHNRKTFAASLAETLSFLEPGTLAALGIQPDEWIQETKKARNSLAHTASHVPRPDSAGGSRIRRLDAQNRALLSLIVRKWMVNSSPPPESTKFIFPEVAHWTSFSK